MMKKLFIIAVLGLLSIVKINAQDVQTDFLWYDNTLPMEDRIEALVEAMNFDEKVGQMMDQVHPLLELNS